MNRMVSRRRVSVNHGVPGASATRVASYHPARPSRRSTSAGRRPCARALASFSVLYASCTAVITSSTSLSWSKASYIVVKSYVAHG